MLDRLNIDQVAKEASKDISLSLKSCIVFQTISEVQMLYVALIPVSISESRKGNKVPAFIDQTPYYDNYTKTWDQFDSFTLIRMANIACYLYIIYQISLIISIVLKIKEHTQIKPWISRALTFSCILHSKVAFLIVHFILIQTIFLYNQCGNSKTQLSSYCSIIWLVLPIVFASLNIAVVLIKELCFYQIRKCKNRLAVTNNLYSIIQLIQKTISILLWLILKTSPLYIAIINVALSTLNLFVIHSRLSFYNLTILRLSVIFTTISTIFSLESIFLPINSYNNTRILIILLVPLALKLSLIKLNHSLKQILHLHLDTPYKAAHLPGLVSKYLKNISVFTTKKKISSSTFDIYGFLKENKVDVLKLEFHQAIHEFKIQAYPIVIENLFKVKKRFPNNELLLLTIAHMYIKHLEDAPQAVYALNSLNRYKSVSIRNSAQDLWSQLEDLFQKKAFQLDKDNNFRNYFVYKGKTSSLKKEIQIEISSHLKFWEALKKKNIDLQELIRNAEDISLQATKIEEIWKKDLEELKKEYSNISIIYGLYLDIVLGKHHVGKALIKKSHEILVSMKDQSRREINEILDGNSAIVIASIEPEKLGNVVDASASVKQLFGIDKSSLIGTHINILLPQMIATRHNHLLKKYYGNFKYGYKHCFQSYAKTISNQYFQVKIDLRLYQNIQQGVSLMSKIRMMSKHISLIVTDDIGKIIDCSQDLRTIFNLTGRLDDLSQLCKEFYQINQAFNIIFKPKEKAEIPKNLDPEQTDKSTLNKLSYDDNSLFKRFLSNQNECSPVAKGVRKSYRRLFSGQFEIPNVKENEIKSRDQIVSINIQKEDAENMCNDFKEGKKLKFFVEAKNGLKELEFETQIEPYLFEGDLYKIWKLKTISMIPKKYVLISEKIQSIKIADEFLNEEEKTAISPKKEESKESKVINPKLVTETVINTITPLKSQEDDEKNSSIATEIKKQNLNTENSKTQTLSITSTQRRNKTFANNWLEIFSRQKIRPVFKISVIIIYLTLIGVISLVVLDSIVKLKSLDDMQKAMGLADIVSKRLFGTIYAWQTILVVYSRIVGLRPVSATTKIFQAIAKNASLEMVHNNNFLKEQVVDFGNSKITKTFFEKTISLWDPFTNKTSIGQVDSFTANERLHSCNLIVTDYPGSIIDLKGREEVLFTINNTANDYLIAVETATNKVEQFCLSSAENDMNYLFILLFSKLLILLVPLILVLILCHAVFRSYSKLMRATSKIENRKIDERINQLKDFKILFEKEIEENIHLKMNKKIIEEIKYKVKSNISTNFSIQNKKFSLRNLLLCLGKYFLFICMIAVPLTTLFIVLFLQTQSTFTDLNTTSKKMLLSYRLGAQIMLIFPNFYFLTIFKNQTSFKIKNEPPDQQLLYHINRLSAANDILVSEIQSSSNEPVDFFVEDLLRKTLCDYMSGNDLIFCLDSTNNKSFGLLGLNSKYLVACAQIMNEFFITPTFAKASQLHSIISSLLANLVPVVQKGYEILAAHFLEKFKKESGDQETKTLIFLSINAITIIFWIAFVMMTVIKKLQKLELGVRKILRVLPYPFIHSSKAMQYYLSDEFKNELEGIKEF